MALSVEKRTAFPHFPFPLYSFNQRLCSTYCVQGTVGAQGKYGHSSGPQDTHDLGREKNIQSTCSWGRRKWYAV